jgi:hypothetical protein
MDHVTCQIHVQDYVEKRFVSQILSFKRWMLLTFFRSFVTLSHFLAKQYIYTGIKAVYESSEFNLQGLKIEDSGLDQC